MKQRLIRFLATMCLAASILCLAQTDAKAEYINDVVNGVSYNDSDTISVGYAYIYSKGAGGYTYISLSEEGDRVTNVKSSSSNLLAKKTYERRYTDTYTDYEYDENTYEGKYVQKTKTSYSFAYISFFAKKAGKYKVTFDVIDAQGKVKCTKTISVETYRDSVSKPIVKSIKYAGKDFYEHYPYATKKQGKLSVKLAKGYSLVSIERGVSDAQGNYVYKKIKNNKTLKLATSQKYSYSNSSFSRTDVDELFPDTLIRLTIKNKKTKEVFTMTYSLCTINKK